MCLQNLQVAFYPTLLQYLTIVTLFLPNCNFIFYSFTLSCSCNFVFQNVTEYFANATLSTLWHITIYQIATYIFHFSKSCLYIIQCCNCNFLVIATLYFVMWLGNPTISHNMTCCILHFSLLQLYYNVILPMWCHLQ